MNNAGYLFAAPTIDGKHLDRVKDAFEAKGLEDISTVSEDTPPKA